MQINSNETDGVLIVQVQGEINITTSPELKKTLEKMSSSKVVMNLGKVDYIDSSGLATLVEMLKKVKQKGGNLSLAQVSEKVKSLFEITKLDRLFGIYPSDEDAIKSLK